MFGYSQREPLSPDLSGNPKLAWLMVKFRVQRKVVGFLLLHVDIQFEFFDIFECDFLQARNQIVGYYRHVFLHDL